MGAGDSLPVSGWILPSLPSLDQPSQPGLQHLGVEHLPCGGLVGGEEVRAPGGLGLGRREGAQVVEEWRQPANSDGLCQDGREGGKVEKRKQLSLIAICTKLKSTIFKCLIFTGATRATLSARWRDNLERCGTVMLSVVVQVHQGEICHLSSSCNNNNQIGFFYFLPLSSCNIHPDKTESTLGLSLGCALRT